MINRKCDYCGRYVDMQIGTPMQCQVCGRNICIRCHHYLHCRSCWEKLTPDQKQYAKKKYKKTIGQSFLAVFLALPPIFLVYAIPVIFFRDNNLIFYTWLIGGTFLLLFLVFFIIDKIRKKRGLPSLLNQLKSEFRSSQKITKKDFSKVKIVLIIFGVLIIFVIVIAVVIMQQFNAQYD